MKILNGNIIYCNDEYIAQQCNCLTIRSHGLSKTLEDAFGHANVYSKRRGVGRKNLAVVEDRPSPGTAVILEGTPNILCVFGQWRPGKINTPYFSNYPESTDPETTEQRLIWFKSALQCFGNYLIYYNRENVTLAVPFNIGCGLAGGYWCAYHKILEEFESHYPVIITLYKL